MPMTEKLMLGAYRGCGQAILVSLPDLQYALYRVVEVEPGPETVDREIKCRSCGTPLDSRKGDLVLKYFLVRKTEHTHRLRKSVR